MRLWCVGAFIGGTTGIYSGLRDTSIAGLTGGARRAQLLNYVSKRGATYANSLGVLGKDWRIWFFSWSIGPHHFVVQSIAWLIDWSIAWLINWLIACLLAYPIILRSIDRLILGAYAIRTQTQEMFEKLGEKISKIVTSAVFKISKRGIDRLIGWFSDL